MSTSERGQSLVVERSPDNEVERVIFDPVMLKFSALTNLSELLTESADPRTVMLNFRFSGMCSYSPQTFREARELPIGEKNQFILELAEAMRDSDTIIIGKPSKNRYGF